MTACSLSHWYRFFIVHTWLGVWIAVYLLYKIEGRK